MIEFIIGDIVDKFEEKIILQTGGIGYNIIMPKGSIEILDKKYTDGKNVTVYTYLHIREDAMVLYGFSSDMEKKIFVLLLGVNKVGPKVAIAILSSMSAEELISNVLKEDAIKISKMSHGVGLKTAQKIILDLKDKFSKFALDISAVVAVSDGDACFKNQVSKTGTDVIDALCVLGYSESSAKNALNKAILSGADDNDLLKEALKYL